MNDAALCYRYATLASLAGLPEPEMRRAYLRAIELKPDFDDARYALGLMEKNAGENEAALEQLRAMRNVEPARLFIIGSPSRTRWCNWGGAKKR